MPLYLLDNINTGAATARVRVRVLPNDEPARMPVWESCRREVRGGPV
jgi:hypothetical protein